MRVTDIFKYFAAFPTKSEVLKIFSNGKSSLGSYDDLKAYIQDLTDQKNISGLNGFVFGSEEENLNTQISRQRDNFLFIEYGDISSSRDQRNSISNSWNIAISVLSKIDSGRDPVEFMLKSEESLQIIIEMLRFVDTDQNSVSWLKYIANNYELAPFSHKAWSAYGWTILAKIEGADLLNIKNL